MIAQNSNDLGQTNVFKYKINLIHPFPITAKPKIFDLRMQRKMKQKIQDLLRKRIIHSNNSPYSASISVIEKKDRTIRICSVPIGLNAAIINNEQSLPNMKELLNTIASIKFYFSWDLISRFWQIKIKKDNKTKNSLFNFMRTL